MAVKNYWTPVDFVVTSLSIGDLKKLRLPGSPLGFRGGAWQSPSVAEKMTGIAAPARINNASEDGIRLPPPEQEKYGKRRIA
jgi:hypothetical protein